MKLNSRSSVLFILSRSIIKLQCSSLSDGDTRGDWKSSKSGGDTFHGDAWEFIRNDVLDARNYFAAAARKPAYRQNQFGFAFSGPVIVPKLYNGRGKTFFFFDYQGTRIAQGARKVSTVPTTSERTSGLTDFADLIAGKPRSRCAPRFHREELVSHATPGLAPSVETAVKFRTRIVQSSRFPVAPSSWAGSSSNR